jgi:hypothetical protein
VASRRNILKFLASAPVLPLGTLTSAMSLSACGGGSNDARFVSASFTGMAAPTLATPANMATTYVASSFDVTMDDSTVRSYKLAYQPFFMTGDMVPNGNGGTVLAGGYVDINNKPIIDASVAGKERQFFSDAPDGTSLLTVPNANVPASRATPSSPWCSSNTPPATRPATAPTACCPRPSPC